MTARLEDWEARLNAFLADNAATPFDWGAWDCALFGADADAAQTGKHRGPEFRGAYDSQAGARKALREHGSGTLLKTYQARFDEIRTGEARRGDLIWNGHAIGVCMGAFALFLGEPDGAPGYVRVPRGDWKRAFKVGNE